MKPLFSLHSFTNLAIVMLLLFTAACARTSNPNIVRGSDYNYVEGYPEVRFSAIGFLNENNEPSINIAADIVYSSLIFKSESSEQQADITIGVRIQKAGDSGEVVANEEYEVTIDEENKNLADNRQSYIFDESIAVPAGQYEVYFTVIDNNSDKEVIQSTETSIPNPEGSSIDLTEIRMLGKDMDANNPSWSPITTYSIPGKVDSLMFVFQVTNNNPDTPLNINTNLLKFQSDTTYARDMHASNYSSSTIRYKGIDLSERTQIQSNERTLTNQGSVFIEFRFAQQARGNYRFEVNSISGDGGNELFKARDFSVKSKNYPNLKTAEELARPLAYLMDKDEYEELLKISDSDSLKQEIDRFWLKNIGNKNEATSVIQKYYQRVEEANKQFATFKEGWKTDTGMIYILFGPPWYVDSSVNRLRWSYSYNTTNPEFNFIFTKPKLNNEYYPFDHFVLERSTQYFNLQYQQKELWLTGLILKRNI